MIGVQIEVPGEPKAAQRPRVLLRKGKGGKMFPVAIKADADMAAQARVTAAWQEQVPAHLWPMEPDRAYAVRVVFHRKHARRADLDNLAKTVLDGLNGVAYPDDSQVTRLVLSVDWTPRRDGSAPSTLVHVRRLPLDVQGNALPLGPSPTPKD